MSQSRKLPRIKKRVELVGVMPYSPSEFNFSFVSAPEKGRQQASGIPSCREHLCKAVFYANGALGCESINSFHSLGKDAPIDMSRLRLLIMTSDTNDGFKSRLFAAKSALNLFEEAAGWKKSTISTVIHESRSFSKCWLITGPGEWMSQPQLLSTCALILRFCTKAGPFDTSNIKSLLADWNECPANNCDDMYRLGDKFLPLVKNHKKIFEGIDLKKAWSADPDTSYSVRCGILSFVNNTAQYNAYAPKAAKKFLDILKQTK